MATDQRISDIKEMEVKAIDKRKSGEAFEVIIKLPGQSVDANPSPLKSPPPKKELSFDEIQSKMRAAEDRRKAMQEAVLNQLKAEEEKVLKVKQKKAEVNDSFSTWAKKHLKEKMSQYEENYGLQLQAKIHKFRALNVKPEELKEKVRREIDNMCTQRDAQLQQRLSKSEQLRKQQIQQVRDRQQEKENHAQQVRQKKLLETENNNKENSIST
ncbi:unnamed protein product [Clavelina lepadiformis]|uniref:Stathmin n=1 Tax=Clavelina lepadiformis TaxID=159417 RepID=A0ABP0GZH6_CLALP